MKWTFALLVIVLISAIGSTQAQNTLPGNNDRSKVATIFASAAYSGVKVTIPPGNYVLDGDKPIPLRSETTVIVYGAHFHLPEKFGDQARAALFSGENVEFPCWFGGHFQGRVFDPFSANNTWEPNANIWGIVIATTPGGEATNLTFRDINSDGLPGSVITILSGSGCNGGEPFRSERAAQLQLLIQIARNCQMARADANFAMQTASNARPQFFLDASTAGA